MTGGPGTPGGWDGPGGLGPGGPGPGGPGGPLLPGVSPRERSGRWAPLAVLVAVAAVLGVATLAVQWAVDSSGDDGPSRSTAVVGDGTRGFACARVLAADGPDPDPAYCSRVAADAMRRPELTAAQRAAAEPLSDRVDRALGQASLRCHGLGPAAGPSVPPTPAGCPPIQYSGSGAPAPPEPAGPTAGEVALIRTALVEAGFTDVEVRLARPDDPAGRGNVLYAVGSGPICLLGDRRGLSGGGSGQIVGRLPDGRCIDP